MKRKLNWRDDGDDYLSAKVLFFFCLTKLCLYIGKGSVSHQWNKNYNITKMVIYYITLYMVWGMTIHILTYHEVNKIGCTLYIYNFSFSIFSIFIHYYICIKVTYNLWVILRDMICIISCIYFAHIDSLFYIYLLWLYYQSIKRGVYVQIICCLV